MSQAAYQKEAAFIFTSLALIMANISICCLSFKEEFISHLVALHSDGDRTVYKRHSYFRIHTSLLDNNTKTSKENKVKKNLIGL